MAWTLLQSDNGNEAGPSYKFRVVCQTYVSEIGDSGYHIIRRYYIEVIKGTSSTWVSTCKSSWNGSNVALSSAGAYDILDIDCGWQEYGKTLDTSSFSAQYTSNSGNVYKSQGTISSYTIPQKPTTIPGWTSILSVTPNPYFAVNSDTFLSYAYNGTLYGSGYYDNLRNDSTARVLFAYAILVSYGDVIKVTGVSDISINGCSVSDSNTDIYICPIEFDSSGNCIYDSGWTHVSSTIIAGQTDTSGSVLGDRSTVSRIVFLFKNSADSDITPQQVLNAMGSTIYFSTSLTYKINGNGGLIDGTSSTTYYRWGVENKLRSYKNYNTSNVEKSFTDPSRQYYNFSGWKVVPSHRTAPSELFTSSTLNSNITSGKYYSYLFDDTTFIAQWEPWTHTILYYADGASNVPDAQTKIYGTSLYIPITIPTREGYSFLGWKFLPTDNDIAYFPGEQYMEDYDGVTISLYAAWAPMPFQDLYIYSDMTMYARKFIEDDNMYIDKYGQLYAGEFIEGSAYIAADGSIAMNEFIEGCLNTLVDENNNILTDEDGNQLVGFI